jgi:general secretion pathway protein H
MRAYPATPAGVAAGFTLLELMVVLVLVGIIFTFAMLSFGGDDIAEMMEKEAHRLETLVRLAADESVIRGQELAIRFTDEGYEFMVLQTSGWEIPQDDRLLRARTLPPEILLRLQLDDDAPMFPDQQTDANAVTPQVFILSSGEVTPFTAVFESRRSDAQYHLDVSLMGHITTERAETF